MDFSTVQGLIIKDVNLYIKHHLEKFPHEPFNIFVGSDSQNTTKSTVYATAIILHRIGSGAHVIFHKESIKKINDRYKRLWGEAERSVNCAEILRGGTTEKLVKWSQPEGIIIDLDFNSNPRWDSYKVLAAATGYVRGMGYKVRAKPESWRSVYAADRLVKNRTMGVDKKALEKLRILYSGDEIRKEFKTTFKK